MIYIKRTLEKKVISLSNEYSCILLIGPRQVGKSTMLKHLMQGTNRVEVTLDDIEERKLAKNDPALFLEMHPAPVLIDKIQYAPELFSYIKILIDKGAEPGSYWLTGSQAFHLMELAQESLAGRAAIIHMSSLAQSELYGDGETTPFTLDINSLMERKLKLSPANSLEIYGRIWKGSMPGLCSGKYTDRDVFYNSYVQTCIERDVLEKMTKFRI